MHLPLTTQHHTPFSPGRRLHRLTPATHSNHITLTPQFHTTESRAKRLHHLAQSIEAHHGVCFSHLTPQFPPAEASSWGILLASHSTTPPTMGSIAMEACFSHLTPPLLPAGALPGASLSPSPRRRHRFLLASRARLLHEAHYE